MRSYTSMRMGLISRFREAWGSLPLAIGGYTDPGPQLDWPGRRVQTPSARANRARLDREEDVGHRSWSEGAPNGLFCG